MISVSAFAQSRYSDQVYGTAPSIVQRWRRAMADLSSRRKHGRCLTTHLALECGTQDPAHTA
eukprot:6266121-Pyramimonas_sp.AAC.1